MELNIYFYICSTNKQKIVEIMTTQSPKKKAINYNGQRFIYDSSSVEPIDGNIARFKFLLNGKVVLKFDDEV